MDIDAKAFGTMVRTISEEKNLDVDLVEEIVAQALGAAYKKDYGSREQDVDVAFNHKSGEVTVTIHKVVVEHVEDPHAEITLAEAKKIDPEVELEGTVDIKQHPTSFGRVAAQTAKQVILQRLREAEREIMLEEYEDKLGQVLNGIVTRVEPRVVRIDLGKATGILPMSEQIRGERYGNGQRIKVLLKDVEREGRGPQMILSRASAKLVEYLFENEVPEMESGAVEIKAIAREAGVRTKLAVSSNVPGVDPVGTFVGGHGTRVQAVMSEIGDDEKIDIIMWDEDDITFIGNALAPTEVEEVRLHEGDKKATVIVRPDQQSIAIGRGGQNVRLASKLTGWDLDIEPVGEKPVATEPAKETETEAPKKKKFASKADLEESLLETLNSQED